ncbi:hypothetical protein GOP47_0006489 [Adiantum capillus-veneris]|uniref:Uncharacterized protein n=1 Tax=Adiantum capillus-veneris TaxID=13818 RepID=A0A9D4ZKC3_ADICA|nr:hypothetical protein GOP47_0006489 [Adiantum capillus-veneris]
MDSMCSLCLKILLSRELVELKERLHTFFHPQRGLSLHLHHHVSPSKLLQIWVLSTNSPHHLAGGVWARVDSSCDTHVHRRPLIGWQVRECLELVAGVFSSHGPLSSTIFTQKDSTIKIGYKLPG